jgi:hypothetical protein
MFHLWMIILEKVVGHGNPRLAHRIYRVKIAIFLFLSVGGIATLLFFAFLKGMPRPQLVPLHPVTPLATNVFFNMPLAEQTNAVSWTNGVTRRHRP